MTEPSLPNWFQVFGEGLRRELQDIKDSQNRLEVKASAIHEETRHTNGRVTTTEGRVTALERAKETATKERRYKGQIWIGPIVGGTFTLLVIVFVEVAKHL